MVSEEFFDQRIIRELLPLYLMPLLLITGASEILSLNWTTDYGYRWAMVTTTIFFLEILLVHLLRYRLNNTHHERQRLTLGTPDYITLTRGFLLACSGGFIAIPRPQGWLGWAPGLLFLMAISGDSLDGYLARKLKRSTLFGEILDVQFDALGTLLGTILALLYGQIPAWYLLVGFGYYFYYLGTWARRTRGLKSYPLPESTFRRIAGGTNSIFLTLAITPALPPWVTTLMAYPFLAFMASSFLKDWFAIIGQDKNHRRSA